MKRFCILFSMAIALSQSLSGQKTAEFGLLLGRAYYIGELNPETHLGNGVGSLSYGALFRYNLNERYALKLNLNRTKLTGSDVSTDLLFNKSRKAEFETNLTDLSANIEFNFLPYKLGDRTKPFTPYLFTGFSYYWYDPSTTINSSEVVTSEANKGRGLAFAFGPGIKLNLGRKMSLTFEWGFRKTSNDLIDGLPNVYEDFYEQGKKYDNDWYVISAFMLTYKLTDEGPCPMMDF